MKKRQLVGIINCTPDSYYEKGRFVQAESAIAYGLQLIEEGADILDIGGESTRPGSLPISIEEELKRVLPVIRGLRKQTSHPLSIDTYKPEVANEALKEGVNWINDISGFNHPAMIDVALKYQASCCVMHMYGQPHRDFSGKSEDVIQDILIFFKERISFLTQAGIKKEKIVLDPGIGGGSFGKTPTQCLQIIKNLKQLTQLGLPIYVGISRKSFLQKILQREASAVLSTTLALNTMALLEGATYIRVHDVAEHRDILTVLELVDSTK